MPDPRRSPGSAPTPSSSAPRPSRRIRFGIFHKILISSLLISSLPILVFGIYAYISIDSVGADIVNRVIQTLDQRTRETMELQAVLTANTVSKFLDQRVKDLFDLREQVPTELHYLQFSHYHESMIWERSGTNDKPTEIRRQIPLYREIAFIDANGWEKMVVRDERVVRDQELRNVRDPKNTRYRSEDYFEQTIGLANGEIFISHLTGYYVTRDEQLGAASSIETAVEGAQYDGLIRFATPVYHGDQLAGIVVLSLDHRHLMELTQHILPNSKTETVFPVYESGDYAFMFDDRGWIITHPKYWDFPGVDSAGNWIPAYSANTSEEDLRVGRMPFNLDSAGFVHENYPLVARAVRAGQSGSVITKNVGGTNKVMAYAPIPFAAGPYAAHGVFGGITIGAEIEGFRGHAVLIAADINRAVVFFRDNILLFVLLTVVLAWLASWLLSRNFARPVLKITEQSQRLAEGDLTEPSLFTRSDEIGVLSGTFNYMARELQASREDLLSSMDNLRRSKSEIESYARNLEYQIKVFQSIQSISNILGSTLQLDEVLRTILQRCVEGLGFDRAILYLIDEQNRYLEYREMYGFNAAEERLARRSRYNLEHFDCIETRVVRTATAAFVEDFDDYPQATELDRKIRRLSKSTSFAFVPLKVKEKIIGILGADKLRSGERVSEHEVSSLQVLANQAARIIENTQLYEALINQRNFVEDIIQSMVSGVITTDSHGTLTSMNRAAESILHLQSESCLGHSLRQALGLYPPLIDRIHRAVTSQTALTAPNLALTTADGERFLSIHVSRLSRDRQKSGDAGAIVILQDVTERMRLDEHVGRIERLASLGRFAAGIAHEIRNPVTGINVFLDDLHDKVADQPEIASLIGMALTEVERLDTLVSEILDYAAPSKGEFALRDINTVIEATLRFTDKRCREQGIRVDCDLASHLPRLLIDGEKIRQALLNIVLNAIQMMPDGGRLTLRTFLETAPAGTRKRRPVDRPGIIIEIGDSGPGIPHEEQEKIFEPFYSNRPGGTGLGLSLTHSIIQEHRGKIDVARSENGGARFLITLPVDTEPSETRLPADARRKS